jgi:hypothetical protein
MDARVTLAFLDLSQLPQIAHSTLALSQQWPARQTPMETMFQLDALAILDMQAQLQHQQAAPFMWAYAMTPPAQPILMETVLRSDAHAMLDTLAQFQPQRAAPITVDHVRQ